MGRKKSIDLSGKRFGYLVVINKNINDSKKNKKNYWNCQCDCGNIKSIRQSSLINNITKSCGCKTIEIRLKKIKKYNTYNLTGEYGIGYTEKGEEFYFDLEDYNKIKKYYWCIEDSGYVISNIDGKIIRMHTLLFNQKLLKGMYVDHIKGNKNDNRKKFLRICTPSQNNMNRIIQSNNTSGVTGVSWDSRYKKWRSRIKINYEEILLGYFDNFDEAVKARKEAEEKYFGEYSFDNSRMKEGIYDQPSCS